VKRGRHPGPDVVPSRSAASAQRSRRLVLEVARHHFGESARRVTERGGGLTNAVYELKTSQGAFIVRTHEDATRIKEYLKEQWAMDAARAAGVPTPKVLEVGNFADGRPYMVAEHSAGIEGRHAPDRLGLLEQLGRAAKTLHGIRTHGFGQVFDWSSNKLSRHASMADFLAQGFEVEKRIGILAQQRMLGRAQAASLRRSAAEMARWKKPPALQHGDLRLKNAIVDPKTGRLAALIDWDECRSLPGAAWDLSIGLHDLGIDEKQAFLAGYGMTPKSFADLLPYLRCFNVLNYADAVRAAVEKKDKQRLAWLRLRLAGALDLAGG
jgi:aminoglycoside phosphotransferase (APT) family kinase protein